MVLGQKRSRCSVFSQTTAGLRDLLSQHEHANGIVGTGHHHHGGRRLVAAVLVMAGQGRCFGRTRRHSHHRSGRRCTGSTENALAGTLSFQGHGAAGR